MAYDIKKGSQVIVNNVNSISPDFERFIGATGTVIRKRIRYWEVLLDIQFRGLSKNEYGIELFRDEELALWNPEI